MAIRHPIYDLGRGKEAGIRPRESSTDVLPYTLTAEDVEQWPKFPLEWLAYRAYGRSDLWERIADVNPIKAPWAWAAGDVVLLPRSVRATQKGNGSQLAVLVRRTT